MHSKTQRTLIRLERAFRDRVKPFIYTPLSSLEIEAWAVGGEPIDPKIALGLTTDSKIKPEYKPFVAGTKWGAPWDTTWFRFTGTAPTEQDPDNPLELVIDFGWADHSVGFQCEGLVYRPDGTIVKALNPRTRWVRLSEIAQPGEEFTIYVEAASNPLLLGVPAFQPVDYSEKPSSYEGALYVLNSAEICQYHPEVAALVSDLEVLEGLAKTLPESGARSERILLAIDRALNRLDASDVPGLAHSARQELVDVLDKPANASAHQTSAMGHAHIDSAWLWPVRETERKVARTLANVLSLLEENQDFVFTMSSAQQYVWIEERYPELFERMKKHIASGRIVPVGGMWVEPDGMIPTGESYTRQILLGQKYFKDHFGEYCDLMWLPDSFGYSGSLPQIAKLGRMDRFLTQKISWNDTNTFPHHSFWWEGIDGTRVLTHFPPSDTYGAEVTAEELDRAARNYRDKAISDHSILLFGYGDGGGGPTREMIERARRFADLEDAPQVAQRTPREFFEDLYQELVDSDACWTGELYLELHRGTFTSQSDTKVGNRKNEALIRQVEAAATKAALQGAPYPHDTLEEAWQKLLLGQFHDILPGTSIAWVHDDAEEAHRQIDKSLRQILKTADEATGFADTDFKDNGDEGKSAVSLSITDGVEKVLENEFFVVTVDSAGLVSSLKDKKTGRELLPSGSSLGQLALYQDEPVMWDAWDLEKTSVDTQQIVTGLASVAVREDAQGVHVDVQRKFGKSQATVTYTLAAGSPRFDVALDIDWHEDEKLLKLLFPFDLHANSALFETQFGYVERAIHENTSWDAARFEVCAHRYLHIKEPGFGIGVVNDASYGYSVGKPSGGSVLVGASVLKSANFPDPEGDRGHHKKRWGIIATPDTAAVITQAELMNEQVADRVGEVVQVEDPTGAVRVSAVKMAHDRSGDVIVRLYEALGSRAKATLILDSAFQSPTVSVVDLVEEEIADSTVDVDGHRVSVELTPFQILTLRVKNENPAQ